MNQIELLKCKIERSSKILDQKRALYRHNKEAMHQDHNELIIPLLCLGTIFTVAFLGKFRNPIFKVGKNIAKIGLKRFWHSRHEA